MLRLQKYISLCGFSSRRRAEELIVEGKVKVNGEIATQLGTKVDPQNDQIEIFGKTLKSKSEKIYIMLNKPRGYETTCRKGKVEPWHGMAAQGRGKTILDLVRVPERVFPVGRLDKDSSGLLILTNDGEFANQMMHPRYEHEKEYLVEIEKPLRDEDLNKLREGVSVLGKVTSPAKVKVLASQKISIVIHEGMNRQVRRMLEAVSNRVIALKRVRIGGIKLGKLASGKWSKFIPAKYH